MTLRIINFLHRRRQYLLLCAICTVGYFLKSFRRARIRYHKNFRAYEIRLAATSYLVTGTGWVVDHHYLLGILKNSFCYFFIPKEGHTVIDLGAGLGEETLVFSKLVGATGMVHAVEANQVTYRGLEYMRGRNGLANVTSHNLAIYDSESEILIEDDPDNYLTNSIAPMANKGHKVRATTFDRFVAENQIARIDFLKVNIEGAEQYLIEGAVESIHKVRHLCISCHDFRHRNHQHGEFYVTRERMTEFLAGKGFLIIERKSGDDVIDDYIYATNREYVAGI
jgi:FkbM family methyltransferase